MEFHISRAVRSKFEVDDLLFNYAGNAIFANLAASREFVRKANLARTDAGQPPLHAAALFAMGLIDELSHALIARYREMLDPEVLSAALHWFSGPEPDSTKIDQLLFAFTDRFPNTAIFRGHDTPAGWLARFTSAAEAGTRRPFPNREAALEELLLLWLANINPAFAPFRELFDDRPLADSTIYKQVTADFSPYFATRPPVAPEGGSLLNVLLAPILASPDSLAGQLSYICDHWAAHLGPQFAEMLRRTLLAVDTLQEEEIAIWTLFHPSSETHHRHGGPGGPEGFFGDEFIGFTGGPGGLGLHPDHPQPLNEYEAFSPDQAWMPTVVLIAKSTYVWLEQLSKKYRRHIYRLDQIPDEELALLSSRGLNGLWLIGLWERSTASQTIKRLRGQPDAVASAYSLKDYRIAEDLGGTAAYERLRDRAAAHGIRLASDMVPNHMGIDSTWVMEHPDWFLSRYESPYPVYSFDGPDLSTEARFEIKIEDHYYSETDAAVVFRLRERSNGDTRYVYHGNDGTTFAWNDTAQLDYSKAYVREQVIQTILSVARLFPIIRFDAAMTLAKKHVQRLWFPLPGVGGSIPSRAESAMSQADFDALMPNEFWREVVDRVAAEVPGTLLLAEAFWLLEGYFVRTLGMHRVYNSAFMNMLRDEENAKYRSYLKKTIEFDPDILKRYVNFMSNPDERTAIDQFGTGDKYFGTCTLLSTLPGLPMFGHGQIEAFTEKYGMEYKQARYEEWPNEDLVARHQREIAPLLKNRRLFAESHNFVLYDFWTGEGHVDENVFVYSNRVEHRSPGQGTVWQERALILYNNSYSTTRGTIHLSTESVDKANGWLHRRTVKDALALPSDHNVFLAWRDTARDLEYIRRSSDFEHSGFTFHLRGYQYAVLQHWRELRATETQPWDRLAAVLNGSGVHSLDEALSKLRLRPVHQALRQALAPEVLQTFAEAAKSPAPFPATNPSAPFQHLVSEAGDSDPTIPAGASSPTKPEKSSLKAKKALAKPRGSSVKPDKASVSSPPDLRSAVNPNRKLAARAQKTGSPAEPAAKGDLSPAVPPQETQRPPDESTKSAAIGTLKGRDLSPAVDFTSESVALAPEGVPASALGEELALEALQDRDASLTQHPANETETLDPSLFPNLFLLGARHFFAEARAVASESEDPRLAPKAPSPDPDRRESTQTDATQSLAATAAALSHLPSLESGSPEPWPATARRVLPTLAVPSASDTHHAEDAILLNRWAPVVAWLLLRELPAALGVSPALAVRLFDELHLRSALSEAFTALGIEGEDIWRLAARVRILLAHPSAEAIKTDAFWRDPDVRWLTGLNQSQGITYLNKEAFEELLWWCELPRLLAVVQEPAVQAAALKKIAGRLSSLSEAAAAAGYDLAKFSDQLAVVSSQL